MSNEEVNFQGKSTKALFSLKMWCHKEAHLMNENRWIVDPEHCVIAYKESRSSRLQYARNQKIKNYIKKISIVNLICKQKPRFMHRGTCTNLLKQTWSTCNIQS